jgi:hypothetical protein
VLLKSGRTLNPEDDGEEGAALMKSGLDAARWIPTSLE